MTPAPRLILFPGMGADARMYHALAAFLPELIVPSWLSPGPGDTVGDYAARYVSDGLVADGDLVGGCSFGGMLALEIARRVRASAVILIGSCRHPRSIARSWHVLAPLPRFVPGRLLRPVPALDPFLGASFGVSRAEDRRLLRAMLAETPPRFLRWGCRATMAWPGVDQVDCPVLSIHGGDDRIIPASSCAADLVIEGAGHLVALTHARAVAAHLRDRLRLGSTARPDP
jgi:pimeloyl-ACP methyl ester carboxylesterase